MYASSAFIAAESSSILSPSAAFSMHQLIISRSVENLLTCSWNLGHVYGWVSDAKGWHIAHAIPVLESIAPSRFWVAPSAWNSRSPTLTCSMKTCSNAFSCSGVCFALCARAGCGTDVTTRSRVRMEIPSPVVFVYRRFIAVLLLDVRPAGGHLYAP